MAGARWPASTLSRDGSRPIEGSVCAVMWPTRSLASNARWFDELYVWTEGFQASTMQRARIQFNVLSKAFTMLETERIERIGVTLSFGTVERLLDLLTDTFDAYPFVSHRLVVLLRGQLDRLRSPYRVPGFIDWLRAHRIPVGYRVSTPRISMEMRAIDLVRPDFIKVMAPISKRVEYWQDMVVETRTSGLDPQSVIVAGIEDEIQRQLAVNVGFGFGQGNAIKPAYDPPSTRMATLPGDPSVAQPAHEPDTRPPTLVTDVNAGPPGLDLNLPQPQ